MHQRSIDTVGGGLLKVIKFLQKLFLRKICFPHGKNLSEER